MYGSLAMFGLLSLACISGCAGNRTNDAVPANVERNWREHGSYYALLEIVDAHIDPFNHRNVSRADVRKYLGDGIDDRDGYPNAGPNFWVYPSSRRVPYGSYLLVYFDDSGHVEEIGWASE